MVWPDTEGGADLVQESLSDLCRQHKEDPPTESLEDLCLQHRVAVGLVPAAKRGRASKCRSDPGLLDNGLVGRFGCVVEAQERGGAASRD